MYNNNNTRLPNFLLNARARLELLPQWAPPTIIASLVVLGALIFLWPAPLEFPMDDAYIHMVYAQNLAEHGNLFFSFQDETGVASSSILWASMLALSFKLGFSMHVLSKVVGVASLAAVGIGIYFLLDKIWDTGSSLAAAVLVALSGNMIWFSLSGMETMLFLALGMGCLLLYRAERWGWLGIFAGLLTLTRPEGIVLLAAIVILEVFSHRPAWRGLALAIIICLFICLPWFTYLEIRTGHFLPTSAAAKQLGSTQAMGHLIQTYHLPIDAGALSLLMFPALWITYLLEFGLGGAALPPPYFIYDNLPGDTVLSVSIWALPGFVIFIVLVYHAARRFLRFAHVSEWMGDFTHRAVMALVLWAFLHNLTYLAVLPIPGTASRYGAINYIILWVAVAAGFSRLVRKPITQTSLLIFIMFVAISNSIHWNKTYDANLEHMLKARIPAARFVKDTFPATTQCAAFDIGVIRYFGGRPIVEVAGLINTDTEVLLQNDKFDEYLMQKDVTCLILPSQPDGNPTNQIDFTKLLGISDSPLFEVHLIKTFAIERDRWLLGYMPTGNYLPFVAIYELIPRK